MHSLSMIAFLVWSYHKAVGETFRKFPSETFVKDQTKKFGNKKCKMCMQKFKKFSQLLLS